MKCCCPPGPRSSSPVELAFNDHHAIWDRLDKVLAKHPDRSCCTAAHRRAPSVSRPAGLTAVGSARSPSSPIGLATPRPHRSSATTRCWKRCRPVSSSSPAPPSRKSRRQGQAARHPSLALHRRRRPLGALFFSRRGLILRGVNARTRAAAHEAHCPLLPSLGPEHGEEIVAILPRGTPEIGVEFARAEFRYRQSQRGAGRARVLDGALLSAPFSPRLAQAPWCSRFRPAQFPSRRRLRALSGPDIGSLLLSLDPSWQSEVRS